ncbi:MAG: hypothetical protein ACOC3W_02390 [Thermodesulfobacteriota bacterium]
MIRKEAELQEAFDRIDATPMRQREMREKDLKRKTQEIPWMTF